MIKSLEIKKEEKPVLNIRPVVELSLTIELIVFKSGQTLGFSLASLVLDDLISFLKGSQLKSMKKSIKFK